MGWKGADEKPTAPLKDRIEFEVGVPKRVRLLDHRGGREPLRYEVDVIYDVPYINEQGKMAQRRIVSPSQEVAQRLLMCDQRFLIDLKPTTRFRYVCYSPVDRHCAVAEFPWSAAAAIHGISKGLGEGVFLGDVDVVVTADDHGKWTVTSDMNPRQLTPPELAAINAGFSQAVANVAQEPLTIAELCATCRMQYIQDDAQLAALKGQTVVRQETTQAAHPPAGPGGQFAGGQAPPMQAPPMQAPAAPQQFPGGIGSGTVAPPSQPNTSADGF